MSWQTNQIALLNNYSLITTSFNITGNYGKMNKSAGLSGYVNRVL